MTRRRKIIIFSIIIIAIVALVWFFYQRGKQQNVRSENGNVGSLFPFTGTNATDYGTEPNSELPQKSGNLPIKNNGNNNGNNSSGSNSGSGNGSRGVSGYGYGNGNGGVVNVLNLNDLNIGPSDFTAGPPQAACDPTNNANCSTTCDPTTDSTCNQPPCTGENCPSAYSGMITLMANEGSSANLTSDGGLVELKWQIGDGSHPEALTGVVCNAYASDLGTEWTGEKTYDENGSGIESFTLPANESTSTSLSIIYTITCDHSIGSASAVVNVAKSPAIACGDPSCIPDGYIIPGSETTLIAKKVGSNPVNSGDTIDIPSGGGDVELDWSVTVPAAPDTPQPLIDAITCSASSTPDAVGWNGDITMPSQTTVGSNVVFSGTANVTLPENTSTSTSNLNNFQIHCKYTGDGISNVNVSAIDTTSPIPGASVSLFISTSTTFSNKTSVPLPVAGGNVNLKYTVILPLSYEGSTPVCVATSSAGDWSGPISISSTGTSTDTNSISVPSNGTSDIISNEYTISCTRIGEAVSIANISGPHDGDWILPGSSVSMKVSNTPMTSSSSKQNIIIQRAGGDAVLSWNVVLPNNYDPTATDTQVSCTADGTTGNWDTSNTIPTPNVATTTTATSGVVIPENNGTDSYSNDYIIHCTHIGESVATINVNGPYDSDFTIPGSTVKLSIQRAPVLANNEEIISTSGGWGSNIALGDYLFNASGTCGVVDSIDSSQIILSYISSNSHFSSGNQVRIIATTTTISSCSDLGHNGDILTMPSSSYLTYVPKTTSGSSLNLSMDGSDAVLSYEVVIPATSTYSGDPSIVCTATSSIPSGGGSWDGDWGGGPRDLSSMNGTNVGSSTITIPPNLSNNEILDTYTMDCTHVGRSPAVVAVNVSGPDGGQDPNAMDGSIKLQVNNKTEESLSYTGGDVELEWNVATSTNDPTPTCTASSSMGDWSGNASYDSTGTGTTTIHIAENASSTEQARTYSIDCGSVIGTDVAVVNVGINPDWNLDRTPSVEFTANGSDDITIMPGTPVDLKWTLKNITGGSCTGTSTGFGGNGITIAGSTGTSSTPVQYAGWGNNYIFAAEATTIQDALALASYIASSTEAQAELDALTVVTTTASSVVDYQTLILGLQHDIAIINASSSAIQNSITTVTNGINTQNTIINTRSNILNTLDTKLNTLDSSVVPAAHFPFLQKIIDLGWLFKATNVYALTSFAPTTIYGVNSMTTTSAVQDAISSTVSILETASTTRASLLTQLNDPGTGLLAQKAALDVVKSTKQGLISGYTTFVKAIQIHNTNSQISVDVSKQIEIQRLQSLLKGLNANIDLIVKKYSVKHLFLVSQGSTLKQPSTSVGTTEKFFSETVGLYGSPAWGLSRKSAQAFTRGDVNRINPGDWVFDGDDGTDGGVIGDNLITTDRTYTIKCSGVDDNGVVVNVPPQTVKIHVDNSEGAPSGSTDATLEFKGNGSDSPQISAGEPVKLTWTVSNMPGGSCTGSSPTGQYSGWGYSLQTVRHIKRKDGTIVDNSVSMGIGDFAFTTKTLLPDPGGTPKAPGSNVGSVPQTFSETIPAGIIATNRTYTLTCKYKDSLGALQTLSSNLAVLVNNAPTLNLLADGRDSEPVSTGKTVNLTWELKNIKGGTCRGSSDGSYVGWGSRYVVDTSLLYAAGGQKRAATAQDARLIYDNVAQGGVTYAGTVKNPDSDVGPIGDTYTEIIGQDGSITEGVERDYTLTCMGIDGTTVVTKTIILNGPGSVYGDGSATSTDTGNFDPLVDPSTTDTSSSTASNPCDSDLDIKTAQIQLQGLVNDLKVITGNTIKNYGDLNGGDNGFLPTDKYPENNLQNDSSLIGDCWSETNDDGPGSTNGGTNGIPYDPATNQWGNVAGATKAGIFLSYLFNEDQSGDAALLNSGGQTHYSIHRPLYDLNLIPWDKQWLGGDPDVSWDGYDNPLPGWKWSYYKDSSGAYSDWSKDGTKTIYVGDLAHTMVIGGQSVAGNAGSAVTAQVGDFWFGGAQTGWGHFNTVEGADSSTWSKDTTKSDFNWECKNQIFPVAPITPGQDGYVSSNLAVDPAVGYTIGYATPADGMSGGMICGFQSNDDWGYNHIKTTDQNNIYVFVHGRTDKNSLNQDSFTPPGVPGCFGYSVPASEYGGKYTGRQFAEPLCGPGVIGAAYIKDLGDGKWDDVWMWYGSINNTHPLGKYFGY